MITIDDYDRGGQRSLSFVWLTNVRNQRYPIKTHISRHRKHTGLPAPHLWIPAAPRDLSVGADLGLLDQAPSGCNLDVVTVM